MFAWGGGKFGQQAYLRAPPNRKRKKSQHCTSFSSPLEFSNIYLFSSLQHLCLCGVFGGSSQHVLLLDHCVWSANRGHCGYETTSVSSYLQELSCQQSKWPCRNNWRCKSDNKSRTVDRWRQKEKGLRMAEKPLGQQWFTDQICQWYFLKKFKTNSEDKMKDEMEVVQSYKMPKSECFLWSKK